MERLTILVDIGERRSGVPAALGDLGIDVVVVALPAGDYVVGPRAVVERKTVADLHRSIATARLWRQLERMRRESDRAWLLVEGRSLYAGQLSGNGVRGALLAVVETGVPLIWSASVTESALWIDRLSRRCAAAKDIANPWVMRAPRRRRGAAPRNLLCAIPGISPALASRLLDRFDSIEAIAAASDADLMCVTGIGRVRSAQIRSLLTGTSRSARSASC